MSTDTGMGGARPARLVVLSDAREGLADPETVYGISLMLKSWSQDLFLRPAYRLCGPLGLIHLLLLFLACPMLAAGENSLVEGKRIVSLAPSNTEIVYALGAEARLMAVSDACDFPSAARSKKKVGSFQSLRVESIVLLRPDAALLVNGQERLSDVLTKQGITTLVLRNETIGDISKNVERIGKVVGREILARALAAEFDRAVGELQQIVKRSGSKPRVFFCVWPEPLMTAGARSFLNEAARVCGGVNVTGSIDASYPRIGLEKLLVLQPDVLVFPFEARSQQFWRKGAWVTLPAVKSDRVYFLPPAQKDPLLRPTLRVLEGLHWLAVRLHPDLKSDLDLWRIRWIKGLKACGVSQSVLPEPAVSTSLDWGSFGLADAAAPSLPFLASAPGGSRKLDVRRKD